MSNALSTSRLLGGLTDGTYYWQVRVTTASGPSWANDGVWWTIHVDAPDPIREYIYLGGKLLASLTLTTGTPVLTYYHTDALGSVRAITDASGNALVRHDYAAFGESISSLQGDPRRYLGQERDAESALDHFGAREYRNIWGRFTAVDPVISDDAPVEPQLWNRYAYGLNNPGRYIDPSGLSPEEPHYSGKGTNLEGRIRAQVELLLRSIGHQQTWCDDPWILIPEVHTERRVRKAV